jgi:hypothetical protein
MLPVIMLASVMFSSFTINHAILGSWVQLGMLKVDYSLDHDVLPVTYRQGYFEAVKIVVRGGPLHMHKCMIYFENGGQQDVELRHNFGKGTESRVIDLKGNKRFIERIEFWCDTKNISGRKALVVVSGRK